MRTQLSTLLAGLVLAGATACDFAHDVVGDGYYGATPQAGRGLTPSSPVGTDNTPMGPASQATPGSVSPGVAGSANATPNAGTAGGGAAGERAAPMMAVAQPPATTTSGASCDLTGRWLSTLHQVTDALGQLQYVHKYIYYAIEQSGDTFRVTKGMQCFNDVTADGDFAVNGDFSGAWPSLQRKVVYAGRAGTSAKVANGCKIDLAKLYTVYGATLPKYLDPSVPLPSAEQKATDTAPGWEDWDGDGNPGITGVMSLTVEGKIFVATREWTALSGTVPDVSSLFKLSLTWDQEPNVLAYDGSPFLSSTAVRAAEPSLHFAQLVRLKPGQATDDDDAICKSVRELAPELTPEAAGM
jgi:hypothetical protein